MATKAQQAEAEKQEAAKDLRKLLQGQSVIYTITEYTKSGTAYVRLYTMKNGAPRNITNLAARAMGDKTYDSPSGFYCLKYGGWGYSKPFQAVYSLGSALYPKGYRHTAKNCHSNDHSNYTRTDGSNFDRSNLPEWHRDGGYKFHQQEI